MKHNLSFLSKYLSYKGVQKSYKDKDRHAMVNYRMMCRKIDGTKSTELHCASTAGHYRLISKHVPCVTRVMCIK